MTIIEATLTTTPVEEREPLWHRMGGAVDLSTASSVEDVLSRSDLDWEATLHPIHTRFQGAEIEVPDRYAVIRGDNGQVLGDVGKSFVPVQNRDLIEFGEVLRTEADTGWDCGGTLNGGKVAFLSFYVHSIVVNNDQIDAYVLLSNGHNGAHALRGAVMPQRLSCGNQVAAAMSKAPLSFSFRHVGDVTAKVEEARTALGMVETYMTEFESIVERLSDIDVDLTFYEDFVDQLIPLDPEAGVRTNAARQRQRAALRSNWHNTQTLTPDQRATGWGAVNLVTEVIDHGNLTVRKSKQDPGERRFLSSLEGSGANLRQRAYDLLLAEPEPEILN